MNFNKFKENQNKTIKLLVINIFLILLVVTFTIVGVFAYKEAYATNTDDVIGSVMAQGYLKGENIGPVLDYLKDGVSSVIKVTNETNESITTETVLNNITRLDDQLKSVSFKYALLTSTDQNFEYCSSITDATYSNCDVVASGDFTGADTTDGLSLAAGIEVPANSTLYYKLIIYIDGTIENNHNLMGKNLNGTWQVNNTTVYTISLDDKCTTEGNPGTTLVYESYGNKFYHDSNGNKMTTTKYPINIPTCKGYSFNGYYDSVTGGNIRLNSNGYLASELSPTSVNDNNQTWHGRWTPSIYTITLDSRDANTHGTGEIYEKYADGYYLNSNGSNKMTSSNNPITIPTKTNYSFNGYYTEYTPLGESCRGTQYIDGNGKITSNASNTNFYDNGSLYACFNSSIYTITLNSSDANSHGTTEIYEKYEDGIYKDSGYEQLMTTSSNNISIPVREYTIILNHNYEGSTDGSVNVNYPFLGYYTESGNNGTQLINNTGYITNDFTNTYFNAAGTLYAHWGSSTSNTVTAPTRDGYTFAGWYTAASGGNKVLNANGSFTGTAVEGYTSTNAWVVTEDKTLYAHWNLNAPAIPTITPSSTTKIYGSSATTLTCTTTSTYPSGVDLYYEFGWSTMNTGGNNVTWLGNESTSPTIDISSTNHFGNRKFYCRVYAFDGINTSSKSATGTFGAIIINLTNATITFDPNEGSLSGTSPLYTRTGATGLYTGLTNSTSATAPTATRNGYILDGWYTAASGGSKVLNADGSFTGEAVSGYTDTNKWVVTENKTLYAHWILIYTITLDSNLPAVSSYQSVITSSNATATIDEESYVYASYTFDSSTGKYTLSDPQTMANAYYNGGNNYFYSGSLDDYVSGTGCNNCDTIYKFKPSSFREGSESQMFYYSGTITSTLTSVSTTSGSSTITNSPDTTLYYKLGTAKFYKTRNGNELSNEVNSSNDVVLPKINGFTSTGYYSASNGGTQYIDSSGLSTTNLGIDTFNSDTTLYSQWIPNVYTITLDSSDADSHGTTEIYEKYSTGYYVDDNYINAMTSSSNNIDVPSKDGYTFEGYYTESTPLNDSTCNGTQYINKNGYITNNASNSNFDDNGNLYACFKAKKFNLTYDCDTNGGNKTNVYQYVDEYVDRLNSMGLTDISGRLLSYDEAVSLGCSPGDKTCTSAPSWVYGRSYWLGNAGDSTMLWNIVNYGYFDHHNGYNYVSTAGVRPVIVISTYKLEDSELQFVNRQNANAITVGDELSISTEHFYVVSSNNYQTVLLARYNLYVGNIYSNVTTLERTIATTETGYGLQNANAIGYQNGQNRRIATVAFSSTNYWVDGSNNLKSEYGSSYPAYVYSNNSTSQYTVGNSVSLTKTCTKSGMTFVGWNTNKDAHSKLDSYTMPTDDVTLYAIYKKDASATIFYYDSDTDSRESEGISCTRYNNDSTCRVDIPDAVKNSFDNYYGLSSELLDMYKIDNSDSYINIEGSEYYFSIYSKAIIEHYNNGSGGYIRTIYVNSFFQQRNLFTSVITSTIDGTDNDVSGMSEDGNVSGVGYGNSSSVGWSNSDSTNIDYTNIYQVPNNINEIYRVYRMDASFTKGSNVNSIGATSGSCLMKFDESGCIVTAPSIVANSGYTADGWYLDGNRVCSAGDDLTLSQNNKTYIAQVTSGPTLIITGEPSSATGKKSNLLRHYSANNNMNGYHSSSTTTWKDLSGHQDGTVTNGTFSSNYLDFGSSGWVNAGQITGISKFTIDVSVTLDSIQSGEVDIVSNYENGGFGLSLWNGKPMVQFYTSGAYTNLSYDEVLKTGMNYQLSATYNGSVMNLYVNGVLMASKNQTGSVGNPTSNTVMAIGANPSGSSASNSFFDGRIYSARIYNTALTQSELKQNMNADRFFGGTPANTNSSTITAQFLFSKDVTDFDASDVTVTNGTKGTFTKISDKEYTMVISGITSYSSLVVSVDGNSYSSGGLNGNSVTVSRYYDVAADIKNFTANQTAPVSSSSITYTIEFNDSLYGLDASDFEVTNGTISSFSKYQGSYQKYTLVVTNDQDGSTQTVTLKSNGAFDQAGNGNSSSSKSILIGGNYKIEDGTNTFYSKTLSAASTKLYNSSQACSAIDGPIKCKITLLRDYNDTTSAIFNKSGRIDFYLNEKTLTANTSTTFTVNSGTEVFVRGNGTIKNAKFNLKSGSVLSFMDSPTISGAPTTVTGTGYLSVWSGNLSATSRFADMTGGTIVIKGGTISAKYYGLFMKNTSSSTNSITISGGTIKTTDTTSQYATPINVEDSSTGNTTITMTGGTLSSNKGYGLVTGAKTTLNMTGGRIESGNIGISNKGTSNLGSGSGTASTAKLYVISKNASAIQNNGSGTNTSPVLNLYQYTYAGTKYNYAVESTTNSVITRLYGGKYYHNGTMCDAFFGSKTVSGTWTCGSNSGSFTYTVSNGDASGSFSPAYVSWRSA